MDRVDGGDGLELDDDLFFDDEVEPVAAVYEGPAVLERHRALSIEAPAMGRQFEDHARFISRFKQPWSELTMDFDGAPDDAPGDVV